jgi:predicted MFS family arabinose efflux permease
MMPYLIDVDPSRRAAVHMSTAMLVGVALGPALASLAVGRHGVTGALWVAGVLYGLTGLVILFNRPAPTAS